MCLGLFIWVEFVFTTRALTPLLRAWGSIGQCALRTPVHRGDTALQGAALEGQTRPGCLSGPAPGVCESISYIPIETGGIRGALWPQDTGQTSERVENISELPVPSLSPSIFSNEVSTLGPGLLFHVRPNEALTCHDFLRACERPENKRRKKPGAKDVWGNVCCVI